jgi:hypothetical protein
MTSLQPFMLRAAVAAGALSLLSACALYDDVSVSPLYLKPGDIHRAGGNINEVVDYGDYPRAIAMARQGRAEVTWRELAALGQAEMLSGRLDQARSSLRQAWSMRPPAAESGAIAWNLSQTEYLANQYAAAREWALIADARGFRIRQWHLDYLESMSSIDVYRSVGEKSSRVPMNARKPRIPRVTVGVNNVREVEAVIDSGAVLSIVSERFAREAGIEALGKTVGTFYGLVGEPIPVTFGLIRTIRIGKVELLDVPVAIMADSKLSFFVDSERNFQMDFLLGTNLLKEFRLELDYPHSRATFTFLDASARRPASNQNLFLINFRPFVHSTINRKGWFLFLLDTGSEITYLNEVQLAQTSVRNAQRVHGAMLQGLGGSSKSGARLENVRIGLDRWEGHFRHIPLYNTDQTDSFGIIGGNLLHNFRVIIDFGRMRVELENDRTYAPFSPEQSPLPSAQR